MLGHDPFPSISLLLHNSLSDHSTLCTWSNLPKVPLNIFKIHIQSVRMKGVYIYKIISRNQCNIETAILPHYTGKYWNLLCVISGFRCEVDENCALLGCYTTISDNSFPTFRDNLSVPSSSVTGCLLGPWRWGQVVAKHRQGISTTRCVIAQKSAVL